MPARILCFSVSLSLQRGAAARVVVCKSPLLIFACYKTQMEVPDILERFVRLSPFKKKKKKVLFWATSSMSFLCFFFFSSWLASFSPAACPGTSQTISMRWCSWPPACCGCDQGMSVP